MSEYDEIETDDTLPLSDNKEDNHENQENDDLRQRVMQSLNAEQNQLPIPLFVVTAQQLTRLLAQRQETEDNEIPPEDSPVDDDEEDTEDDTDVVMEDNSGTKTEVGAQNRAEETELTSGRNRMNQKNVRQKRKNQSKRGSKRKRRSRKGSRNGSKKGSKKGVRRSRNSSK